MPRPRKKRILSRTPRAAVYKPAGVPLDQLRQISLLQEELEALRLADLEGLTQADEDLRSLAGLGDRRFLQAATAGRPSRPSFDDALVAHRVTDACYRSAAAAVETVSISS